MKGRVLVLMMLMLIVTLVIICPSTSYARPLVDQATSKFGNLIEGAAVDAEGNLYAVNYEGAKNKIGRVTVTGEQSLYFEGPSESQFNGIRVDKEGNLFVADLGGKRVIKISSSSTTTTSQKTFTTFCESKNFLNGVPNDLTLHPDGSVFLSGQAWTSDTVEGDGEIWFCPAKGGQAHRMDLMGRTNGIAFSPDGKTLYVTEAFNKDGNPISNKIWKYKVHGDPNHKSLNEKQIFVDFASFDGTADIDTDGIRLDVNGNLYVTRNGGQKISIINPSGQSVGEVPLSFQFVTNVELGGANGKTGYAIGRCGVGTPYGTGVGCVDVFAVDAPGLTWSQLQKSSSSPSPSPSPAHTGQTKTPTGLRYEVQGNKIKFSWESVHELVWFYSLTGEQKWVECPNGSGNTCSISSDLSLYLGRPQEIFLMAYSIATSQYSSWSSPLKLDLHN